MKVYELNNALDLMTYIRIYRQFKYYVYAGVVANFTDDDHILDADVLHIEVMDNDVKIIIPEDWN